MNHEEVKLKRLELKTQKHIEDVKAQTQLLKSVIENPIIALVAGVAILEALERAGITGPIITTTTEVGLIGVTTAKALAPLLETPAGAAVASKVLAMVPTGG